MSVRNRGETLEKLYDMSMTAAKAVQLTPEQRMGFMRFALQVSDRYHELREESK